MDDWVNCAIIPSGLLRGEQIYRVRRHDGTVVEGFTTRKYLAPSFHLTLQKQNKKEKKVDVTALWGFLAINVLETGPEKTLIAMPDSQVVLVNNCRVVSRLPEFSNV